MVTETFFSLHCSFLWIVFRTLSCISMMQCVMFINADFYDITVWNSYNAVFIYIFTPLYSITFSPVQAHGHLEQYFRKIPLQKWCIDVLL